MMSVTASYVFAFQNAPWDTWLMYAVRLFRPLVVLKKKKMSEAEMTTAYINATYGPWLKLVMWDDGESLLMT
jgi:hypothetical protein